MATKGKRPFGPEDFYSLRDVADVQLSPDGKQLAYVVTWSDRESDQKMSAVYVVETDGRSKPVQFTTGTRDSAPRWSPDGQYLAFVSKRGEEEPQLFLASLAGGEARQLTKARFGVSHPAWSPDGKRMTFVATTGDVTPPKDRKGAEKNAPRVIRNLRYRFDGVGYYDERRPHIFTVDVETAEQTQVTKGDYEDSQPVWSPDGKLIAFVSDRDPRRFNRFFRGDVWVVPSTGGRPTRITPGVGRSLCPAFSPDGTLIAYKGSEDGIAGLSRNLQVYVVPVTGGVAPRSLNDGLDRGVIGAMQSAERGFVWHPDGRHVVFVVGDHGATTAYWVDLEGHGASKLLGGDRQITSLTLSSDGTIAYYAAIWPSKPPEIYAAPISGRGRERTLSDANNAILSGKHLAPSRRIKYKSADRIDIEAFVQYPQGFQEGRRYPLALLIHGGPHAQHPMPSIGWLALQQSLASAGYVVFAPNPRGSAGYGQSFMGACVKDNGGKDYGDLMTGVDMMVERGVADPRRLYVWGRSYGGYMSAWVVGQTDRFSAAAITAPNSNLVSKFGTQDIGVWTTHQTGGTPWDNTEEYLFRSPITYLPNVKTPVLLTHQEGDLRCPITQSEEIFTGLKVLGKEVEFVRYPGGFHSVRTPSQEVDQTERIIAWFDAHRGSRASSGRKA